jgi:hypothetical protein
MYVFETFFKVFQFAATAGGMAPGSTSGWDGEFLSSVLADNNGNP